MGSYDIHNRDVITHEWAVQQQIDKENRRVRRLGDSTEESEKETPLDCKSKLYILLKENEKKIAEERQVREFDDNLTAVAYIVGVGLLYYIFHL